MKLIGLMPVRNEDWVLGLSARVALQWCDMLILYVHASTDRSWHIALDLQVENGLRVHVARDDEERWNEMQHRQRMLTLARQHDATHVAIIDADEILTGNLLPQINNYVADAITGFTLQLPGFNLRNGISKYHSSGIWGRRWFSVALKDDPRLSWGGDCFHSREPRGFDLRPYRPIEQHQGGVLHLWGASERRLQAKHAMYKVSERLRWPNKSVPEIERMYSWAIHGRPEAPGDTPSRWRYAGVPPEWWAPYAHWMQYLDVGAEPWQEAEVRRLVAKHGAEAFKGLDLFGVA